MATVRIDRGESASPLTFPVVDDTAFSFSRPVFVNGNTNENQPFVAEYLFYDNLAYGLDIRTFDDELDQLILKEANVGKYDSVRYTDGLTESYTLKPTVPDNVPIPNSATILGTDITVDIAKHVTGGVANAFMAHGMIVWNFATDAKQLFDAFTTTSSADEEAIVTQILSGDDTIYMVHPSFGGVSGLAGNDIIYGSDVADFAAGGVGNDTLRGRQGADELYGEADNDLLIGGGGSDFLDGGTGADTFVYNTKKEGKDIIQGFDAADVLQFEGSKFGLGSYAGTLKKANFVSRTTGHAAGDANDYFIYDRKTDQLWYDANGKGKGGDVMIADLTNDFKLKAIDIEII